ncbi:MAG: hypothetical protein ABFD25_18200 [Clostridiaceae bacterium]
MKNNYTKMVVNCISFIENNLKNKVAVMSPQKYGERGMLDDIYRPVHYLYAYCKEIDCFL